VDFVEICNVCVKKAIIKAAKRTINSDKMYRSYSDLNFGVTFFGTQCIYSFTLTVYQIEPRSAVMQNKNTSQRYQQQHVVNDVTDQ